MIDPKQIALSFLQAFWDGRPADSVALCAPDAVWTFQKSLRERRLAEIPEAIDFLMDKLVGEFDPDSGYEVIVHSVVGDGDEIAIEYSACGRTRRGDVYDNDYLVRFTLCDGLITSVRPYFDTHYVHRVLARLD
jgi:ketosteroid isomerase-like protein